MKSYAALLLVACAFVGCSKPSAGELMAGAVEAYKLQDYQRTLDQFAQIIELHPESPQAEEAAFRSAAIYQNDMHESQKAVNAYNRYVSLFPEGKNAPTALFLVGYMYNNELHKLDSASIAYKAFLEKYPDDEMATSAKFELDNLGRPVEELVPRSVASEQVEKKPAERGKN